VSIYISTLSGFCINFDLFYDFIYLSQNIIITSFITVQFNKEKKSLYIGAKTNLKHVHTAEVPINPTIEKKCPI
jgi:hypothetical protein